MLLDPPGAKQSALRLCKSCLRCSWKHLELQRCIQDGTRFDLYKCSYFGASETSAQICGRLRESLKLLRLSAGYFKSSRYRCAALLNTRCCILTAVALTLPPGILFHHICLCYSHKICYIIIWHALFQFLNIYAYGQSARKWYSSIIGETPGYAHLGSIEMHHLEAIVVNHWS